MNIDHIRDQITAKATDTANLVARAQEGTVSLQEVEEFGRHGFARIALVRDQLNTLEALEMVRSVEATIEALP